MNRASPDYRMFFGAARLSETPPEIARFVLVPSWDEIVRPIEPNTIQDGPIA